MNVCFLGGNSPIEDALDVFLAGLKDVTECEGGSTWTGKLEHEGAEIEVTVTHIRCDDVRPTGWDWIVETKLADTVAYLKKGYGKVRRVQCRVLNKYSVVQMIVPKKTLEVDNKTITLAVRELSRGILGLNSVGQRRAEMSEEFHAIPQGHLQRALDLSSVGAMPASAESCIPLTAKALL